MLDSTFRHPERVVGESASQGISYAGLGSYSAKIDGPLKDWTIFSYGCVLRVNGRWRILENEDGGMHWV